MRDSGSNPMETPRWRFIIRASGFSALVAITLASLIVVSFDRPSGLRNAAVGFGYSWFLAAFPMDWWPTCSRRSCENMWVGS